MEFGFNLLGYKVRIKSKKMGWTITDDPNPGRKVGFTVMREDNIHLFILRR